MKTSSETVKFTQAVKYSLILIFSICINANVNAQAIWNNKAFVHRNNQQILDGENNAIKLDGVNLGGWLMWEGWLWGGGFTGEKDINKEMQSVISNNIIAFKDSVYKNFITRADIKKIAQLGFNVVRIPFNHTLLEDDFTPYTYKLKGWSVLDSALKWCEDYNIYAVLDLHAVPGGASSIYTADPDSLSLWQSNLFKNRTVQLWKAIANRYTNRGIIAGYDLLNEPNAPIGVDLNNLYLTIRDSIRLVDKNHMLFIEGNNYAQDFGMFNSLPDQNMVFEFHIYTWFYSTKIAENLNKFTLLSKKLNVPVWCGEWGENDLDQLDATVKFLNDKAYNFSGHCFWTWKKMKNALQLPREVNFPYLVGIDNSKEWDLISTWINNKNNSSKPNATDIDSGINKFIHSIKLQNCSLNITLYNLIKQTKDTIYPSSSNSIKLKLPSFLSINGNSYPNMTSLNELNKYNFISSSATLTFPLFVKLHLGTLKKPLKYSGLFCTGSFGIAEFQSTNNISPLPLYSQFLGGTYLRGSIKNNYIAGLYAFENADQKRFLDAPPNIVGLFLYSHQNNKGNTFIAGIGALALNNNSYALPVIGYLGKINKKVSYLILLPLVATINYKPNDNNRISFIIGPQGNYYKIKGSATSIGDTVVTMNSSNLQTSSLKSGISWTKKMNNKFELFCETGVLSGNTISVSNSQINLKEKIQPSAYLQIGLTLTINPNRLNAGLKQANEGKFANKSFSKQKSIPLLFNIERIYLD